MGRNPLHPGVLDAEFLLEEGQFVGQTVDLGPAPGPEVPVVRGSGDEGGERVVAQGQMWTMEDLTRRFQLRGRGSLVPMGVSVLVL